MHETGIFPDLIESIYDAGLQPALWNDVVVKIKDFVGGQACGVFSKDSMSKFGVTHYYCGVDPHFIQLYSETHSKFDPLGILPPLDRSRLFRTSWSMTTIARDASIRNG